MLYLLLRLFEFCVLWLIGLILDSSFLADEMGKSSNDKIIPKIHSAGFI